jgi:ATP phosphoribosyltransferase
MVLKINRENTGDFPDKLIKIAVSKGRGFLQSIDLLKIEKSAAFDSFVKGSIPAYYDELNNIQLVMVRSNDLPWLLWQGHVDVAIGSSVWFEENHIDLLNQFMKLDIQKCRLSLIASVKKELSEIKTVCTRYPILTKNYFALHGFNPQIIIMTGCHEVALTLKLSDAIIDIIETGRTIERMQFVEIDCLSAVSHGIWTRNNDHATMKRLQSCLQFTMVGDD